MAADTARSSAGSTVRYLTPAERSARGKAARAKTPLDGHAAFDPPEDRPDPVELLVRQAEGRLPELLPIRYGRMLSSPFAFYRGAAAIMASDLSRTPRSGLRSQLCGDAHISNFGGFASPGRDLVFDVNDFDETLPGPFEWDVKRLAASVVIASRERGSTAKQARAAVRATVAEYRTAMRAFAAMRDLDVFHARLDVAGILERYRAEARKKQVHGVEHMVAKARTKDSLRAFAKLTHEVDGERRIISDPPLIVPLAETFHGDQRAAFERAIQGVIGRYRRTLLADRKRLLEGYRYVDLALKVVGVGSVGTRCWIGLMLGRDDSDPLFLQFKEAQASVLAPYVGKSSFANQGERVVDGQRLMQATSDIFLGWDRVRGIDGKMRDFYVRQLWDWKLSPDIATMTHRALLIYAQACGWTLALAHARTGDRIAIAAYMGGGDGFDVALGSFAEAYADQNERDHQALADAVRSKRIVAKLGL